MQTQRQKSRKNEIWLTSTGSLSIRAASFRAKESLILWISLGRNDGKESADTLKRLWMQHLELGPPILVAIVIGVAARADSVVASIISRSDLKESTRWKEK